MSPAASTSQAYLNSAHAMGPAYDDESVHLRQQIASCVSAGAADGDGARISDAVVAAVEVRR